VVKNVEVIAAYRRFSRNVNARPVVVTLMAKRRDAQKLESAATQGELNLVLH
jgi:Flp pilus assembly protein CpaB